MLKKVLSRRNQDPESDPDDLLRESGRATGTPEDLGTRLRAEMLPASHATPHMPAYPRQFITAGRFGAILMLIGLLGLGWFFGLGPGRPLLEDALVSLANRPPTPTSTQVPSETPKQPTATPPAPATATLRPSASSTATPIPETATETPTETPASTCRDYFAVTVADVGQELCVQGIILRVLKFETNTLILFSDEPGAFYLVTYDVPWSESTIGTCYQVTGEIQQLLSSPIIIFGYTNLPVVCP
jgi:hypothetical protein